MNNRKFLDRKEAEQIFELGFVKYDFFEMVAFSRYCHHLKGWGKAKIEKHIRSEFFKAGQNIVVLSEQIHKAVLLCRFDFLEHETVIVTKNEIEKIKTVKNREYQKSVFGILVFAKKYGIWNDGKLYFNRDIRDYIKKVGVNIPPKDFSKFSTYIGIDTHLIDLVIRKTKSSWRINFAEEVGELFCEISDFSNIVSNLPYFCSLCGEITESKKSYCDEHSKEVRKENKKEWLRNYRKSS